jgi:alpha-L-arabinofuranosidase
VITTQVLTGNDLKAVNTFESPQTIRPQTLDRAVIGAAGSTVELPPRSYTVIQMA